eukprot:CAMPEP_0198732480 /NCGR_PEP_ID=MMETSP1475-20131203/36202_1 /TAXON_ID= ORGANISM="Unidentified sp., Strain CCMP1999" /NCGR_SAMPLE_ID=MMETSP1475 /ASSEMBLY_ACC=CAM_ASM_001111 /LENGTH=303 /DNA_ID=CAMNT_0044495611 /DNA_START=92 /DNA_END=1003 /DNA_ORIENTATION=-
MRIDMIRSPERNPSKSLWSKEEDETLVRLVQQTGSRSWTFLAKHLHGRSGKQCRERWVNHLDPAIKKDPWTPAEDNKLLELHAKLGNRWVEFAKELSGRSENSIKNRWNSILKKRVEKDLMAQEETGFKRTCGRALDTQSSPVTPKRQRMSFSSSDAEASIESLELNKELAYHTIQATSMENTNQEQLPNSSKSSFDASEISSSRSLVLPPPMISQLLPRSAIPDEFEGIFLDSSMWPIGTTSSEQTEQQQPPLSESALYFESGTASREKLFSSLVDVDGSLSRVGESPFALSMFDFAVEVPF